MGLENAIYLEILAFAYRSGLGLELVKKVFPDMGIIDKVQSGNGNSVGVKFRELPYYVEESTAQGFELPITKTLYDFCNKGERVVIDDHREAPAFWHELLKKTT